MHPLTSTQLWQTAHHHFSVYLALVSLAVKQAVTYRLNTLVGGFYSLVYYSMLAATTAVVIPQLAPAVGWSQAEMWLLFGVTTTINSYMYTQHMHSFRFILREGISNGLIDQWILKPVSPQFILTHLRINGEDSAYALTTSLALVWLWWPLRWQIAPLQYAAALLTLVISWMILYFWLSILAGSAFFITRSEQLVEVYDKSTDLAHYPQSIFPTSLRLSLLTLLPIGYLGYTTTTALLGKLGPGFFWQSLVVLLVTRIICYWVWKYGLRHYSSVSN